MSRPSRARGLKLLARVLAVLKRLSRPSRARGLKRRMDVNCWPVLVAPLAGAWIETVSLSCAFSRSMSRPSRARGLKHERVLTNAGFGQSRPSRARGLKQKRARFLTRYFTVAPLAGAWIETDGSTVLVDLFKSRPSRARGLKQEMVQAMYDYEMSRPSRARGLKRFRSLTGGCQSGRAPRGRVD